MPFLSPWRTDHITVATERHMHTIRIQREPWSLSLAVLADKELLK